MDYEAPREAIIDALTIAVGGKINNPHPMAFSVERPLEKLAMSINASSPGNNFIGGSGVKSIMTNLMGRPEFSGAVAKSLQAAADATFKVSAAHRAYCSITKVDNFRPVLIDADVDVGLAALEGAGHDAQEIKETWTTDKKAESGSISTWAKIFSFSRHQIINNDTAFFSRIAKRIGSSSAAIEANQVAGALDNTQTLADGKPAFGSDEGNLVTCSTLFSEDSLSRAVGALRNQEIAPGLKTNAAAKFILVNPSHEVNAKHLLNQLGLAGEVQVFVLPGIQDDRYYLTADPEQHPTISVLNFEIEGSPFLIEQKKAPIRYDGMQVRARLDTGAVLTSRQGIVRCQLQ